MDSRDYHPPETVDELAAENALLRELLAYRVAGWRLYRDDGELQDNSSYPFIDFKRDPAVLIESKLRERIRRDIESARVLEAVLASLGPPPVEH